ncbi:UNKNOWN [Stylonychia lemnae]|uniref:Myb-like domain-containing protein n=1 Tax=Stylonychia lemnae TaxID=5949 RepID=A0A078B4A5_STYLE|nr:UNKNOWN [Stylonychia lemnae]|eukprot:CDW88333.1 UNKNOWN [Stylonychia lemnae]
MTSTAKYQAQQHLLPKQLNQRVGSISNELDYAKRNYIIKMRQSFIEVNKNIYFEDGSLNFKYFNVKKGHYWSKEINEELIKYGVTNYKDIKQKMETFRSEWSETEIRLRICRLLKCYNLKAYENRKFNSKDEILDEAIKNKEEATKQKKICGGILYNPVAEQEDGIMNSYFNLKNKK